MGDTIIDRLLQTGDAITGKVLRIIGAVNEVGGTASSLKSRAQDSALIVSQSSNDADAFGRFRVTMPDSLFDSKCVYDKAPFFFDEVLTGAGATSTFVTNQSSVRLRIASGSGTGQSVVRQSFISAPYEPGRSQLAIVTGILGTAAVANAEARIGLFDASNGLFFERQNSTINVVVRTSTSGSVVNNRTAQSSWNLDKLDGTGASGITLDPTKVNGFVFDFAWLGVGIVRFGLLVGNRFLWCHQVTTANTGTVVYMSNPALPVRYEVATTGTIAANADVIQICSAVFSEGGWAPLGAPAFTSTRQVVGSSVMAIAGVRFPMLTLRLKSAYNRGAIIPRQASILATGTDNFLVELVVGGTRSGGSPTTTSTSDAVEVVTSTTIVQTLTGGRRIAGDYGSGNTLRAVSIGAADLAIIGADTAGTPQELHVMLTSFTAGNFEASINWSEVY